MILSKTIAKTIVSEINKVIPMSINIMDENGIIIASSDSNRIDTFHQGAYHIIQHNKDELHVLYDGQFDGALAGLNYPLKLKDVLVGVIGITGNYAAVKDISSVIKKMTEILLENIYTVEQKNLKASVYNRYLSDYFEADISVINTRFIEKGKDLGLDITLKRRIIMCNLSSQSDDPHLDVMHELEKAQKLLKRIVISDNVNNFYFESGSYLICGVIVENDFSLTHLLDTLIQTMSQFSNVFLSIGVDGEGNGYREAKLSLAEATKALKSSFRHDNLHVRYYDELNMEIFSSELSQSIKREYVLRIFQDVSSAELDEMIKLLDLYYSLEGSINKTADKLFVHKNTVQNRLLRIMEITGYDPRSIKYSSLFYNAIYFYRDLV